MLLVKSGLSVFCKKILKYIHIHHSIICAWSRRRNYFSKPRIEGEKTLGGGI